ncbi:hypothetical protein J3F83DRAFT_415922 [Trichoderma novae-zelandiae]
MRVPEGCSDLHCEGRIASNDRRSDWKLGSFFWHSIIGTAPQADRMTGSIVHFAPRSFGARKEKDYVTEYFCQCAASQGKILTTTQICCITLDPCHSTALETLGIGLEVVSPPTNPVELTKDILNHKVRAIAAYGVSSAPPLNTLDALLTSDKSRWRLEPTHGIQGGTSPFALLYTLYMGYGRLMRRKWEVKKTNGCGDGVCSAFDTSSLFLPPGILRSQSPQQSPGYLALTREGLPSEKNLFILLRLYCSSGCYHGGFSVLSSTVHDGGSNSHWVTPRV